MNDCLFFLTLHFVVIIKTTHDNYMQFSKIMTFHDIYDFLKPINILGSILNEFLTKNET